MEGLRRHERGRHQGALGVPADRTSQARRRSLGQQDWKAPLLRGLFFGLSGPIMGRYTGRLICGGGCMLSKLRWGLVLVAVCFSAFLSHAEDAPEAAASALPQP